MIPVGVYVVNTLTSVLNFVSNHSYANYQTVYDEHGVIIHSNFYQELNHQVKNGSFVGKTLSQLSELGLVNKSTAIQLEDIRKTVITTRNSQKYFIISEPRLDRVSKHLILLECTHIPLLENDYSAFGTLSTAQKRFHINLNNTPVVNVELDSHFNSYKLTSREMEVVYLLANNLSQREIAAFFGVNRGSISQMIAKQINRKLGLSEVNEDNLKQKIIELGLHTVIPHTLIEPKVILF